MDRVKAEELLTDMLAGNISAKDLDELLLYEERNSEFGEYRADLETVWGLGETTADAGVRVDSEIVSNVVGKVSNKIFGKSKRKVIDFDTLNLLSAAGSEGIISNIKDNLDNKDKE